MKKLLVILAVTALSGTAFAQGLGRGVSASPAGNGVNNGSGGNGNGSAVLTNRSPNVQVQLLGQGNFGLIANNQNNQGAQGAQSSIGIGGNMSSNFIMGR